MSVADFLDATQAPGAPFIAGLGASVEKAAMMLSAQTADNAFHYGLVGGIGVAASSPRLCCEAFPSGPLTANRSS